MRTKMRWKLVKRTPAYVTYKVSKGTVTVPAIRADNEDRMGFRLLIRRKELGMSQYDLAVKAGVSQGVISYLESGKRDSMSMNTLRALSVGLGVTTDFFLMKVKKIT